MPLNDFPIDPAKLSAELSERFPVLVFKLEVFRNQATLSLPGSSAHAVLKYLKEDLKLAAPAGSGDKAAAEKPLRFDVLSDLTAVDYAKYPQDLPERFAVVYQLTAFGSRPHVRLRVKASITEETPVIDSVTDLWASADWLEREAFDMYGVQFAGHPNLIRILLPDYYQGHPLRKDYPLKGRGERDSFPKYTDIPEETAGR
ncbi:MAG: NADH-quinone oxidoreductase subunit C [Planctomycetota bacterium]